MHAANAETSQYYVSNVGKIYIASLIYFLPNGYFECANIFSGQNPNMAQFSSFNYLSSWQCIAGTRRTISYKFNYFFPRLLYTIICGVQQVLVSFFPQMIFFVILIEDPQKQKYMSIMVSFACTAINGCCFTF